MKDKFFMLRELLFDMPSDIGWLKRECRTKLLASIFLGLISVVLTVFNIVNGYTFMTVTTCVLIVGFLCAALVCLFARNTYTKIRAVDAIMALMCSLIFSIYALTGENDGFAILWILLMPLLGMSILRPVAGIAVSGYFLVFLVLIFYTPLRTILPMNLPGETVRSIGEVHGYTETFMARFPVLYLADMGVSMLLSLQKQYYSVKAEKQAYTDMLTGLSNRNMYITVLDQLSEKSPNPDLTLIALDLNGLKQANDNHGHEAGDEILIATGDLMRKCFDRALLLCRTGGDEFCVITTVEKTILNSQINTFRRCVREWKGQLVKELAVSVGVAALRDHPGFSLQELGKAADDKLYDEKAAYYRLKGIDRRGHSVNTEDPASAS